MVSRNNRLRSMRNRNVTIDFGELVDFQDRLHQLSESDLDGYYKAVLSELGSKLFGKAVKRTPVDTGLLRGNWQMTKVTDMGAYYEIRVLNPTEYAHFVELGHRTRGRTNWVRGRFMLQKATLETEAEMPKILESKLVKFLKERLEI